MYCCLFLRPSTHLPVEEEMDVEGRQLLEKKAPKNDNKANAGKAKSDKKAASSKQTGKHLLSTPTPSKDTMTSPAKKTDKNKAAAKSKDAGRHLLSAPTAAPAKGKDVKADPKRKEQKKKDAVKPGRRMLSGKGTGHMWAAKMLETPWCSCAVVHSCLCCGIWPCKQHAYIQCHAAMTW